MSDFYGTGLDWVVYVHVGPLSEHDTTYIPDNTPESKAIQTFENTLWHC